MHRPPRDTDETRPLTGQYQYLQMSTSRLGVEGGHARSVGAWSGATGNPTSAVRLSGAITSEQPAHLPESPRQRSGTSISPFRLDSLVVFPVDANLDARRRKLIVAVSSTVCGKSLRLL